MLRKTITLTFKDEQEYDVFKGELLILQGTNHLNNIGEVVRFLVNKNRGI